MSTGGLRLGETHLFAGYVKQDANGEIQPKPGSLEPVRNTVLLTSGLTAKKQENRLWPWMTDSSGRLTELGSTGQLRGSPVHYLGNTRKFHLPPPELLLAAWAAYRDEWPKKLAELLVSKAKADDGLELTEYPVKKSHLKEPDRDSTDETDAAYCTWFDNQPEQARLFGYILPKTRGLVMLFSKALLDGKVTVTLPNGTSHRDLPIQLSEEGLMVAILIGSDLSLPHGLYTFEVAPPQGTTKEWNASARATGKYELKDMVRFPVTNFAGDFDLVLCDPLSVEEAVMAQFPALYGHIALMTKARALHPDLEVDFGSRQVPKALKEWSERSAWAHSKAAFGVGMINAGSEKARARKLGKLVWGAIESDNQSLSAAKNALDLAFGLQRAYGNWGDTAKMLKAEQDLQGVKQLAWDELDSTWQRYRWWKYMKLEYAEGGAKERKILKLAEMPKEDLKLILKAGVPEKFTRLQKLVGKGAARTVTIGLTAAETALGVVDAALAFNEISEGKKDLEDVKRDFRGLLEQVDSKLGAVGCREGMGNLERMRAATVAVDLKLDGEEVRALMAALDVILGVLCTVGIGEAAIGVYLFAKGAANALMSAAEFFDREALRGFVKTWFATQMRMSDLASQSRSNQGLMRSSAAAGGNDEHHIQFRLRAEALTGLVKLFVRASVSSRSEEEYRERVKKYRIAEYVQQVLLNEGWQFPLRPLVALRAHGRGSLH
jgi:hypothetical protein